MPQDLGYLKESPSQTAGPYVHIGLIPKQAGFDIFENDFGNVIEGTGERIRIEGVVYDGAGTPLRDALVEIWQADKEGRYDNPKFRGWARAGSDFKTGEYVFETVKPGPVPGRDGGKMAPHVCFWIVARGINIGLSTRMYFSDEEAANADDPVLNRIEQKSRRATLIGQREDRGGQAVYRFDVRLQGEQETVFFDT